MLRCVQRLLHHVYFYTESPASTRTGLETLGSVFSLPNASPNDRSSGGSCPHLKMMRRWKLWMMMTMIITMKTARETQPGVLAVVDSNPRGKNRLRPPAKSHPKTNE